MKICVIGQTGKIFFESKETNPWSAFFEHIITDGNSIVTRSDNPNYDALICLGYHPSVLTEELMARVPLSRRILINWEPESVEPELYLEKYYNQFGHRLSPSRFWAEKIEGSFFPWPQEKLLAAPKFEDWKIRELKIAMIQANKYSAHKDAMYALRRRAIWKLGEKGFLKLYGKDWKSSPLLNLRKWVSNARRQKVQNISLNIGTISRPPSGVYVGEVLDKNSTYKSFQIALVIENSLDYLSEKLFDAVSAGCVVVYVGAPLGADFTGMPQILLPKPTLLDIEQAIYQVMNLTDEQRFRLFASQYEILARNEGSRWNFNVFENLAQDCLRKLYS